MKRYGFINIMLCFALLVGCAVQQGGFRDESGCVVFEDFESGNYDGWEVEGTAFGNEPHTGKSPTQQPVYGYLGKRLVNTYLPDDKPTGKMTSRTFEIEKPYIAFLVGGGKSPEEICMNLVVNGKVVQSQTGNRSEQLFLSVWDVKDLIGKKAFIEIVDNSSGGWGHINVDHIVFCDEYPEEEKFLPYKPMVKVGEFTRIYDPSVGEDEQWYINDHCFIYGPDNLWHLIGITHEEPPKPLDEDNLAHAVSPELTEQTWKKLPFALSVDWDRWRECHLWAPHIILHEGVYYMYYCAGDPDHTKYKIHLATSKDLMNWTRHPENPMVVDGFDARDPFIFRLGDRWVMYYTATDPPELGNYVVAYRTSKDLLHWGEKKYAYRDEVRGKWGGPTESPFIVRRGKYYYLFIGPRGGYVGTDVFVSKDPLHWDVKDQVGHIDSHALEVIRDLDGKWYVSACGWRQGGVYLAPLTWLDGVDDDDTSMPIPKMRK
jgi:beta-fructofuranosidase